MRGPKRLRRLIQRPLWDGTTEANMLELFSEFARDFTRLDTESWTILLIMVGWATLILQISVDSKSFTSLFIPGMVLGGMGALYAARIAMFTVASAKEINVIVLSVIGIMVGFLATLLVILAIHWIKDLRRPLTIDTRS
jgi:hypothetical protein